MADIAINRSLSTVRNELQFLCSSGVITADVFAQIDSSLPRTAAEKAGPASLVQPGAQLAVSPPSYSASPAAAGGAPTELAEALYDYRPADSSDLPLYRGAQIVILERVNPDWWRGRDKNTNAEGIFPAAYVRVTDHFGSDRAGPQYAQPYAPQYIAPTPQPYIAPTPQPYIAPSPQPYTPPQQQQPQQQPPQQQQQHHPSALENAGKRFGKKLGNAAIFGAGATIGSDIVNSIF